jgi:hypothetical protein
MTEHLKEFNDLVDMADTYRPGRGMPEPPDEEGITRCIQVMLARQCIYGHQHHLGPPYRVLSTPAYQPFFRKFFAAMGLEFVHDMRSGMVALKVPGGAPRFDHQRQQLRKDETAVLLALRLTYEEVFRNRQFNDLGTVDTTTDELYDKLAVVGNVQIDEGRLKDILALLKRKGIVELHDRDPIECVTPLTILPGIEVVVPSTSIERVRAVVEGIPTAAERAAPPAPEDGEPTDDSQDLALENGEMA